MRRFHALLAAVLAYRDPLYIIAMLAIAWLVARVGEPVPVAPGTFAFAVIIYTLTAFAFWLSRREARSLEAERNDLLALADERARHDATNESAAVRQDLREAWLVGTRDELSSVCDELVARGHADLAECLREEAKKRGTTFAEETAAFGAALLSGEREPAGDGGTT